MKGIVFSLLHETVAKQFGEDTWDTLLDTAKLDGVYTSVGSYPDTDLLKLVDAASSALEIDGPEVLRWFGISAMPLLIKSYPQFFEPHTSTKSFMLTLNDIIHPEVRKLYPGAEAPDFDFEPSDNGTLTMGYASQRKFCGFAIGLIQGVAPHFGETVEIEHPRCMNRGDDKCQLVLTFRKRE